MKFTPFKGQIEIEPIKKEGPFAEGNEFIRAGEVITVGEDVHFFKIGDIAHFLDIGCYETTEKIDGKIHYVVTVNDEIIRGKHEK